MARSSSGSRPITEHALGWLLERRSDEQYVLEVEGEDRPAVFAYLAVPEADGPRTVHERLEALTAELRLVWTGLAAATGDGAIAARHRAEAELLGAE